MTLAAIPHLEIRLRVTGRICLVEHRGEHTVLFLDARHNPALELREHLPLLHTPANAVPDGPIRQADSVFAEVTGEPRALWNVAGFDMRFEGLSTPVVVQREIEGLADLNQIYARVDPEARWRGADDLLRGDSRRFGVLARLSLAGFSTIRAVDPPGGGPRDRRFRPGEHQQEIRRVIECHGRFPFGSGGPILRCDRLDGHTGTRIAFSRHTNLTLALSNLCRCTDDKPDVDTSDPESWQMDNNEFAMYFDLLEMPPIPEQRPLPYARQTAGGGTVPECYEPARLVI